MVAVPVKYTFRLETKRTKKKHATDIVIATDKDYRCSYIWPNRAKRILKDAPLRLNLKAMYIIDDVYAK